MIKAKQIIIGIGALLILVGFIVFIGWCADEALAQPYTIWEYDNATEMSIPVTYELVTYVGYDEGQAFVDRGNERFCCNITEPTNYHSGDLCWGGFCDENILVDIR